ncbi:MAG: ATP phosphoribosyltransferase regulatory subunit [Thermoanaerobaculales bacterium]
MNALQSTNPGLWLDGARRLRDVERRLTSLWATKDYGEVMPPLVMPEEAARAASPDALAARTLRIPANGDGVLALRSDFTASVAWMVSRRMAGLEAPLRIYYSGSVMRRPTPDRPEGLETLQAGCERISPEPGPEGDGEVALLAAMSLAELDVKGAVLEFGHWGLVGPLIERIPWPAEGRQGLEAALNRKSVSALDQLGDRYGRATEWSLLKDLVHLGGRPESVEALKPRLAEAGVKDAWEELLSLAALVGGEVPGVPVRLEPTDVRHWAYYTGLTVKAFAPGHPYSILSGGRYDSLYPSLGRSFGACGFAVQLGRLIEG